MRALPVQIHVNAVPEPDRPPRSSSSVTNALTADRDSQVCFKNMNRRYN